MTTTPGQTIEVRTVLTKQVLVPYDDIVQLNTYGEYAKFIGQAFLVDEKAKTARGLRFETDNFVLDKVEDIHKAWLEFDKKVTAYAEAHLHEFAEYHTSPTVVKIT